MRRRKTDAPHPKRMRARLERWIELMRTGFWFVPLLMLGLATALALTLLYVDQRVDPGIKASLAWAYSGGPEGARSLLSTIAGSMITAASVTFSFGLRGSVDRLATIRFAGAAQLHARPGHADPARYLRSDFHL